MTTTTDERTQERPRAVELDLTGDLPSGTWVLQASAGTGKTYAIAALVTRAVAEGVCELPELLVVTFTRAATAELRDRVRRRLVGAERHLRAVLAGTVGADDTAGDAVLACIARGDRDTLAARHGRLARALTDFDAATISTIHGFTQQVLRSVGLSADVPRDLTLLEDGSGLLDEVTDDVYVRRYLGAADAGARLKRAEVAAIARVVAGDPDAPIRPDDDTLRALTVAGDGDPATELVQAAERVAVAVELRAELRARKQRDGTLGYDDLLLALRDALADPDHGPAAASILRGRYRWALIDEFQDTDPVQWDILARAFRDPTDRTRALVLIGDPKQAIYSFRGADVRAYLAATDAADTTCSLAVNYRSDGPLLEGIDGLLTGTSFGERDIPFVSVRPSDEHHPGTLVDDADPAALQLRVYDPPWGKGSADTVRRHLAVDVTATLLDQLGRVRVGDDRHPLRPEDVAVLVRTNAEARLVQQCLRDARVPSVVNGVGSVLSTAASDDWRWLLEAVERPSDPGRVRRLALSSWIGWDAERLARADDDDLDQLHESAHALARVLVEHGVAALERTILSERRVAERLLRTLGGERHLTDLGHIGELLHTAELDEDRGVSSLRSWLLAARVEAGDTPTPSDEQARRLESDARSVQILTVHRSKGLEYPVVLVPFHWSAGQGIHTPVVTHEASTGRRVIDVGPSDRPGFEVLKEAAQRDATGEMLRLLYVAVTRGRHRVVVWWQTQGGKGSALARVLFGRGEDGQVAIDQPVEVPKGVDQLVVLEERFTGRATSVTAVPGPDVLTAGTWPGADDDVTTALRAARFERALDRAWRRTSYSGIVRQVEQHGDLGRSHPGSGVVPVASEPDVDTKDDEPDDGDEVSPTRLASSAARAVADPPSGADHALTAPVPLGGIRGGTAFGTFVHAVLEHTDFTDADLDVHLGEVVATHRDQHRVPGLTDEVVPTLTAGLAASIRSPLGPLAGHTSGTTGRWRQLSDVPRSDRLDELDFELPLAGGDDGHHGGAAVAVSNLAALLDRPADAGGLADDDPIRLAGYPDRLRRPGFALDLRGYLSGSIDLVLRLRDADGSPRFLVIDHKTNRLGGDVPTLNDYRPARLTAAMIDHDYPLQALLYQVALHRYLRWRVTGYDAATHLGGTLYLFLRGMAGPATPEVDDGVGGVFGWRPPAAVVTDLSDLLDAGAQPTTEVAP